MRSAGRAVGAIGLLVLVAAAVPGLAGTGGAAAASGARGVLLPDGRLVTPAGAPTDPLRRPGDGTWDLGDFPLGLAVSPDGTLAGASLNGYGYGIPNGFNSFCQSGQFKPGYACPGVPTRLIGNTTVHSPDEGVDLVDLASGKVTQTGAIPTSHDISRPPACNQRFNCMAFGVAFSKDGTHLYAAGGGADAIYDFTVSHRALAIRAIVPIASLAASVNTANVPQLGQAQGFPRSVKVVETPRGERLIVADTFDSTVELFDISGGQVPKLLAQGLVPGGAAGFFPVQYLYDIATSPDGGWAYVSAEGTSIVYALNLALFEGVGPLTSLAPGAVKGLTPAVAVPVPVLGVNHPTGLAVSPDGRTLAVTGTDSDTVAFVPIVGGVPNGASPVVVHVGAISRPATVIGSSPDAVAYSRDGRRAYVAMANDDAVAVIDTAAHTVLGNIPTAWYPTAVSVGPDGSVYTVSAKGYGSRYVASGGYTPSPGQALPPGASLPSSDYYDGENMPGVLQRFHPPSASDLAAYTAEAADDVLHAGGLDQRMPGSPIPAKPGDPSPITHVVYVVRENRTFDQIFGDLGLVRKDVDADPYDQVLAAATPNAHALAQRFAISDNFFSDGEASVQGHWWTSSAMSDDYIEKSWRYNYSGRGWPGDQAIAPVTTPGGCSLFEDVQRYVNAHPAFTARNYGELVGSVTPSTSLGTPTSNLCGGALPVGPATDPAADPNYPSQIELVPDDRGRATEFLKDSGLKLDGSSAGNGNSLRNFNYLILSEDHTSGLAGKQTPRSQVAQNDAALGEIISALSRSKYWASTAVIAVEDDSQDGTDHVDGHRNVLVVASPWTKHASGDGCGVPGYIGHAHYDQASVVRTIELILGLNPISAFDAGATPLYDLFQAKPALTAGDLSPYAVAAPPPFIDETVASLKPTAKVQAMQAASRTLNTTTLDVSEPQLEALLWQSVRDDPLPADLAAKVGATASFAGDEIESVAAAGGAGLAALSQTPGLPPVRSTATGQVLAPGVRAAACATPVVATTPVAPGQTGLGGRNGPLPVTGGGAPCAAWLGGLALVAAGAFLGLRRTVSAE